MSDDEAAEPPPAPVSLTLPEFRRAVIDQLARANAVKDAGNGSFKEGDLENASARYMEALDLLAGALTVPALRRPDMADLLRRADAAHAACHLNLAACALKRSQHETACEHAEEAARVQPRCAKAHFRRAQALLALGREAEAAKAAQRAAALDPRAPEVAALARRCAAEAAGARARERQRFGGLFASPAYEQAQAAARAADAANEARHRGRVVDAVLRALGDRAPEGAADALAGWAHEGASALAGAKAAREAAARAVREAARAGALEDGEARATLREHGLGAALLSAGDPAAEGLSAEEAAEAAERADVARVRGIIAKARDRQALSAEELAHLDAYRAAEVARLQRAAAQRGGATQEELALLAALQRQREEAGRVAAAAAATEAKASDALRKLKSGAHMGPRERYDVNAALAAEEARLAALEEAQGLRSEEAATLRELRSLSAQRAAKQQQRAAQQEQLKLLQALSVV